MGSFTTPPCAENVVWFIGSKVRKVGSTVVEMF
jgi:carbonic anhydrase